MADKSIREQIEEAAKSYKPASGQQPAAASAPAANDDWKVWNAAAEPEKPGFFSSLWNTLQGPRDVGNAIIEGGKHLLDTDPKTNTLNRIGNQTMGLGRGAVQDFKAGKPIAGIRKGINAGINAVVPGLGAQSEDAGQEFDKGNAAAGFGKTLGIGGNVALGLKVPAIARGTASVISGRAPNPFRLNPEVASEQAFRPAPTDSDFPQIAPSAFSDVKTFGGPTPKGLFGRPKVGVKDLAPGGNTTTAIEALQNQGLEPWLARARSINTQINGDQIVTATRDAIPKLMWTKDPAGAAALVREAQQTWGGKQFTPDDFRDFLKTGNAGLSRFYKQAPTSQQSAITAGTAPAISDAETSGIRKALYDALDPEGGGAGPRQIQERTGAITNLRNAAERRSNAILGEKPVSPAAAAGRIIASPFEAATIPFRSNPESTISRALHPIQGRSDALIGGLYRQAPDAPPLPAPSPFPAPRGLLGPGPAITPAPADTSFVRSAPAMTQPPNPARALGAGPQVFTAPPPADTSFVRGAQGMAQPPNPGRALPPAPDIHITDVPADMSFVRGVPPAAHQRVNMEPRMLPQGTAPFTQGTSVPDILGRPGQTTNKLLEAPRPGEPPLNVLPEDPSLRVPSYMPSGIRRPRQLGPAK